MLTINLQISYSPASASTGMNISYQHLSFLPGSNVSAATVGPIGILDQISDHGQFKLSVSESIHETILRMSSYGQLSDFCFCFLSTMQLNFAGPIKKNIAFCKL